MDKLISAIANKVLEISNEDNLDIREKLLKINRFKDFVSACHPLIEKYPEIEKELLQMVADNNFDSRVASAYVNIIIKQNEETLTNERKIENETQNNTINLSEIEKFELQEESLNEEIVEESFSDSDLKEQDNNLHSAILDHIPDFDTTANSKDQPIISINNTYKKNRISTLERIIWTILVVAFILIIILTFYFFTKYWKTILLLFAVCVASILSLKYLLKRRKHKSH